MILHNVHVSITGHPGPCGNSTRPLKIRFIKKARYKNRQHREFAEAEPQTIMCHYHLSLLVVVQTEVLLLPLSLTE